MEEVDLLAELHRLWGYSEFRPLQERAVRSILAKQDVAVVMPTGGGKSLCYQLPAVLLGGTCVVVSPLVALMQDQAAQLDQAGIPAAVLNSSLNLLEQRTVIRDAMAGRFRLLYLSPERLAREDTMSWLGRTPVSFFAIDEAHCISEWGHEFRPEYRQLGRVRESFPGKSIAAFTASATQRVRHDILHQLHLREPHCYILSFHRPNLRYAVRECTANEQTPLLLATLSEHDGDNLIVYCPTIKSVEETTALLNTRGIGAVSYHGQMEAEERRRNQELWMSDEKPVLVGTIAFGLGINKPDVRAVVHLSLPKSLEQYYQEAGRAGRDGEPADCILLWQKRDIGLLVHFIKQIEDRAEQRRAWDRNDVMKRFVTADTCRARQICLHFGEKPKWESCAWCDRCAGLPDWLGEARAVAAPVKHRPAKTALPARGQADEKLLADLKAWRREIARGKHVPAYVVMHDSTLAAIAGILPLSMGELLEVPGIGERRAATYGEELLALVRNRH